MPTAVHLSQFKITDSNLMSFERNISAPMDCVISAMEVMGVINSGAANIMRISTIGAIGITKQQIELIFAYALGKNFEFDTTSTYTQWTDIINEKLHPGHVVFAGVTGTDDSKHVFMIGRNSSGALVLIDPSNHMFCDLASEACVNRIVHGIREWHLLFSSDEFLTAEQQTILTQYMSHLHHQVHDI